MIQVKNFFSGLNILMLGYKTIMTVPGLKMWVLFPLIIDIILLFLGISWGSKNVSSLSEKAIGLIFEDNSGWLYTLLYYPLLLMFWVVFAVLLILVLYVCASVLAAPFNSIVAEKVLIHEGVMEERPFHLKSWTSLTIRMLIVSTLRAFVFAVIAVFLFILAFIPGLNIVSSFCGLLMIAFDGMDYSMEMLEYNLKKRFEFFNQNIDTFSGMASALGITLFIPGLTILVMPLSVAGAAKIMANINGSQKKLN